MAGEDTSVVIQGLIERLRAGDESARTELLTCSNDRFMELARKMFRGFPRLERWVESDDVAQGAVFRIERALREVELKTARDFFRLAATQIRRELIDLKRKYYGPLGPGTNQSSHADAVASALAPTSDPINLAGWGEFHSAVDSLGDGDRELFDLLWYHGLTQAEVARLEGVSERTVSSRWLLAKVHLHDALGGLLPF
jgi:RNA polymerase sigma-70 factor (ECF subfamily)